VALRFFAFGSKLNDDEIYLQAPHYPDLNAGAISRLWLLSASTGIQLLLVANDPSALGIGFGGFEAAARIQKASTVSFFVLLHLN
jgi:hypothetical protein